MSQTDLNVANASGAVVRADLNAHIDALATNSSGAVAPSPTFPNQWWMDTSTNILKQRDNSNTTWVNTASKVGTGWVPYRDGVLLGDAAEKTVGTGTGQIALNEDRTRFKNTLVNGDFRVAQVGTSFTSVTTPANDDDTYLFDQWVLLSVTNDVVDVTQETSDVPVGALNAVRFDIETANLKFGYLQILEARDAAALIGGTASLSFKAKRTGTSINNLRAAIISWDGTSDVVTSDVVSAWSGAGVNPVLVANWTFENTPVDLAALTTSYQTFKIENISIDTANAKNVALFIWSNDVTTTVGDLLFIGDVQLEPGVVATPFERRPFEEDMALCQRYYFKTFLRDTAPAQNAGFSGALHYRTAITGIAIQSVQIIFPVQMRAISAVIFYNPAAANALWRNVGSAADSGPANLQGGGDVGLSVENTQLAGDNASELFAIHITADARL